MEATAREWGVLPDGRAVHAIRLSSPSRMSVEVVTYGATVTSIAVPSASTGPEEVTLCYRDLDTLRAKAGPYYGATVGRVANRIAKGKFKVDGKEYSVAVNNGANHLHGGLVGWDKCVWSYSTYVREGEEAGVRLSYTSKDGEEGYPGTVVATAEYALTAANEVRMTFIASTDAATPINMCNHTYYNLSGDFKSASIADHTLQLFCPFMLAVDTTQIPTGLVPVAGGVYDFATAQRRVGEQLLEADGSGEPGYDHCFSRVGTGSVPAKAASMPLAPIAVLRDPSSGRSMTVSTNEVGVQLYTGNWLSKDKADAPHTQHAALCLETENFPDAINKPAGEAPDCILRPGETYTHVAVHKFEW